ncbi:MAG: TetR/AcrR family transcriptional regulator [Tatlockia sp.]|nr:TetR/AcrR family transcriptional regulator [Tatlockia sp.]
MKKYDIYQQILNVAEILIQSNGYNAFSYKDIAKLVDVKTSSIHYHFPTKADLGKAVVKKHIDYLSSELEKCFALKDLSSKNKLEFFIDSIITNTYLAERRMCLGGMLASDVLTLPEIIQSEVQQFFLRLEELIKQLLKEAVLKKEFFLERENIEDEALFIFSLIEGALLLARLFQDEKHLMVARREIMNRLVKD